MYSLSNVTTVPAADVSHYCPCDAGEDIAFGNDAVMDALDTIAENDDCGNDRNAAAMGTIFSGGKTAAQSFVNGVPVGTIVDPETSKAASKVLRVMVWDAGMCVHAAAQIVKPGESLTDEWVWSRSFSATDLQPACPAIHLPTTYTGPDAARESTHFDGTQRAARHAIHVDGSPFNLSLPQYTQPRLAHVIPALWPRRRGISPSIRMETRLLIPLEFTIIESDAAPLLREFSESAT